MSRQAEIDLFWKHTTLAIDATIAYLDNAPAEAWNWKPAENASSLYALATHAIGSTEEHILEGICAQPVGRDREAEFAAIGVDAPPFVPSGRICRRASRPDWMPYPTVPRMRNAAILAWAR